jgi:hypothetical protein
MGTPAADPLHQLVEHCNQESIAWHPRPANAVKYAFAELNETKK